MAKQPDTEQPAVAPEPSPIENVVNQWFIEHFHNHGPAVPVELFNHFRAAKDKLIQRLAALTKED